MKMSKESYNHILSRFKENKDKIIPYAEKLKEIGGYKDFYTRLGFDCLRAFIGSSYICDIFYGKEGLNDNHITTAVRKALKELGL